MPDVTRDILKKTKNILAVVTCILSVVLVSQFAITANVVTFNMEERYEKTYGLCLRIVDRLEQTPGYKTGDKVAFIGGGIDESYYPYTDFTSWYLKGYFGVEGVMSAKDTGKIATFCSHYLNFTMAQADWEEHLKVIETEEFEKMHNFPAADSIQKIGEIWVVKLNG